METRRRTQDGNGNGSGDVNESSSGDGNRDDDGSGNGNEDGIGEPGREAKKRKKPHKNCRRDQAFLFRTRHHLYAHRTERVTGSEGRERENGAGGGIGVGGGNGDGNGGGR